MEKNNKLTTLLTAMKKLLPVPLMAGAVMNFSTAFANPANTSAEQKGKTAIEQVDMSTINNYKSDLSTFNKIYNSDLAKLTDNKSKSQAEVNAELNALIADMNADIARLANYYQAYAQYHRNNLLNKGLTNAQINQISNERGTKTKDDINVEVGAIEAARYAQIGLKALILIGFEADEASITSVFDKFGIQDYITVSAKGKNDQRNLSEAVLSMFKSDIVAYSGYDADVKGKDGKNVSLAIARNMNKFKAMSTESRQTKANQNAIVTTVKDTAGQISSNMYGSNDARTDLMGLFAARYSLNALLSHLKCINYNITNLKAEDYLAKNKASKTTFNGIETRTDVFNTNTTLSVGTGALTKWNNNFGLAWGGEFGVRIGYGETPTSFQTLGILRPTWFTKNGQKIELNAKAGLAFDKEGVSTPFGLDFTHTPIKTSDVTIGYGVTSTFNVQRNYGEIGVKILDLTLVKNKKCTVKFSVVVGYAFELQKEQTKLRATSTNPPQIEEPDPEPENPEKDPGYGAEKPGTTIGDTNDMHIIPHEPDQTPPANTNTTTAPSIENTNGNGANGIGGSWTTAGNTDQIGLIPHEPNTVKTPGVSTTIINTTGLKTQNGNENAGTVIGSTDDIKLFPH